MDVLLSSGFLAFARHLGFRRAFLALGDDPTGICGTSSGSVVGALWANGLSESTMIEVLNVPRPISKMTFNWRLWRGLFRMDKLRATLQQHLPERIEDLPIPFGVGVMTAGKRYTILRTGPLVPAIAASCAIPYIFEPVTINGEDYGDGGFVDRIGAQAWREMRPDQSHVAHIVDRSNGAADEKGLDHITVVRTPRSFASFWNMGDFDAQLEEAYRLSSAQLP